jgi:hypothetical protein
MAKPQKHGNKWRIRPVDEFGKRSVLSFDSYEEAELALKTEISRVALTCFFMCGTKSENLLSLC